jgi:hypothetical protein
MQLQEIKHESCPICKSRIIMIRQKSQHSNWHWNEIAEYECGCIITFSPNFMREEFINQCPKHPDETLKKAKRNKATQKLEKYINRLDVDEEFKSYITIHGLRIY